MARVLVAGAVLATLLAVPVLTRLELGHSRARLDAARSRAAGAAFAEESADRLVTDAAARLTTDEADAVAAARTVAEARARLAATGVSEAEVRATLDETQRRLDDAVAARDERRRIVAQLDELLPQAKTCLADSVRLVAVVARTADPDLSPSDACRAVIGPG